MKRAFKIFRILPLTLMILLLAFIIKAAEFNGIEIVQDSIAMTGRDLPDVAQLAETEPASGKLQMKERPAPAESAHGEGEEKPEEELTRKEKLEKIVEGNENGLPDYVHEESPGENIPRYSDAEKEMLEKLSIRRIQLERWAQELDMKANLIEATSKKLEEQVAELEKLKSVTEELLGKYNDHDNAKLRSLVKIYEGMKAKEAAEVFNQMDMEIMLEIIDRMSERKAAPILAKMDTKRARELTEKLANQKSLATAMGVEKK